ncbi:unnamed protein product (macronuclear) [Paramecium tetraurelia]|uniref:Guanylate cyclase domain-containing protein n=1 Tax=Paramecium tetraurelia TaxID=5888 RepID=A0CG25_PARTE|nr:uncharacterized protein GSPATT00038185001 [Paramecium tetraurelia]CAK69742.1 unnamed protein product [Paramecium tetraurelia]|eukprot:XP_001437139.1 hypothetical protein (macronuclear) [Paramecium tetraurelia strain d4-2]
MTDQAQAPPDVDIFQQTMEKNSHRASIFEIILESTLFQVIINILTLYALFGDDVRVAAFRLSADIVFDALNITCLIMFSTEIILSVIVKEGYFLSFFFWLDTISTISLLLDISLFNQAVGLSGAGGQAKNTAGLARAGRASRVGTKAGRVVRLVRLIRLVKVYKSANKDDEDKVQKLLSQRRQKRKTNAVEPQLQDRVEQQNPGQGEELETKESKVSKMLSDSTTKKVIIVVLALLFLIPLFSVDYFVSPPTSMLMQSQQFVKLAESEASTYEDVKNAYSQIIIDHSGIDNYIVLFTSPLYNYEDFPIYQNDDYPNLRTDEQDVGAYTLDYDTLIKTTNLPDAAIASFDKDNPDVVGILSTRQAAVMTSILSIIRTIFVSIVLTFGAMMFSKDSNDLALRPLERMIEKINKIANDPQIVTEMAVIQNENSNETVKIENTIVKIGTLLALGFGDAGTEIIRINMKKQGDVDPMLPGIKKVAIYGFCDIRNFTDATEVLQEDVMVFVNNIGDIVHTMVDRYMGAANKNIGDAFLLVWKTRPETYSFEDDNVIWHDKQYISTLSDCALISFMKIQCKINREPKILAYRQDKRLQARMDNYKVKIGFGLHMGWGIEGAIGSNYKIDASYLSPNVNMASRLEAATKQYGVPILISESLYEHFSPEFQEYIRHIDRVCVKGSNIPVSLYTIDMNVDNLPPSNDPSAKYKDFTKEELKMLLRQKKLEIKEQVESGEFKAIEHLQDNKDMRFLLTGFKKDFMEVFGKAFQAYLDGDWKTARAMFQEALKLKPNDGPTEAVLHSMEETNYQKPSDWKGYRELTEK